jgi:hypothetical protein
MTPAGYDTTGILTRAAQDPIFIDPKLSETSRLHSTDMVLPPPSTLSLWSSDDGTGMYRRRREYFSWTVATAQRGTSASAPLTPAQGMDSVMRLGSGTNIFTPHRVVRETVLATWANASDPLVRNPHAQLVRASGLANKMQTDRSQRWPMQLESAAERRLALLPWCVRCPPHPHHLRAGI